jgi:hypothetical protein
MWRCVVGRSVPDVSKDFVASRIMHERCLIIPSD